MIKCVFNKALKYEEFAAKDVNSLSLSFSICPPVVPRLDSSPGKTFAFACIVQWKTAHIVGWMTKGIFVGEGFVLDER